MARLYDTTLKDGSVLTRMVRPRDWDHMAWCAEPGCENITRGGWRAPCASVYGWTEAGGGFVGWRAACSRKHALSVWRRDVDDAGA